MSKIIKKAVSTKIGGSLPPRATVGHIMPEEGGGVLGKKVLDAKDKAQVILDDAASEAARLNEAAKSVLAQVNAEMEKAKKEGYAKGHEEGAASVVEYAVALNNIKEKFYAGAEPEMIKLVMTISEKVIGKIVHEHSAAIKSIIRQAIESSLGEKITVRLNPEDYKTVMADEMELKDIFDRTKRIAFKEDESIKKGGCVVETEVGTIDARLDTQLKAIKKALQI